MSIFYAGQGAPTNGTSGTLAGTAFRGDVYQDISTGGLLYTNLGTLASPTWTPDAIFDTSKNLVVPAVLTVAGAVVNTPSAAQTVTATTGIVANAGVVQITAASGLTVTATPTISAGVDGQQLTVVNSGTANAITVKDSGSVTGSNILLRAGATALAISAKQANQFVYSSALTSWLQVV